MAKKKFVLRVDENTMAALERWAADDFRSINGQLEWVITRALKEHGRLKPSIGEGDDADDKV